MRAAIFGRRHSVFIAEHASEVRRAVEAPAERDFRQRASAPHRARQLLRALFEATTQNGGATRSPRPRETAFADSATRFPAPPRHCRTRDLPRAECFQGARKQVLRRTLRQPSSLRASVRAIGQARRQTSLILILWLASALGTSLSPRPERPGYAKDKPHPQQGIQAIAHRGASGRSLQVPHRTSATPPADDEPVINAPFVYPRSP